MYSLESAQLVREMKERGMTTRAIAKSMKMSRTTVITLLKDRAGVLTRREKEIREPKAKGGILSPEKFPRPLNPNSSDDTNGAAKSIVFVRCSGCGAKVQSQCPCLACYINELLTPSSSYPSSSLTAG